MAVTEAFYTGNNSTVLFNIPFFYIDEADVKVTLDGVTTTAFVFANASTIQFNTAPGFAVRIRIYRQTNLDTTAAIFYPGSSIKADDLNDNFKQNQFTNQEAQNSLSNETYFYQLLQNRALANDTTFQPIFDKAITLPTGRSYFVEAVVTITRPLAAMNAHNIQFTWSTLSAELFAEGASQTGNFEGSFSNTALRFEQSIPGTALFVVTGPTVATTNSISAYYKISGTTGGASNINPKVRFTVAPGAAAVYSVLTGSYIRFTRVEPLTGPWS